MRLSKNQLEVLEKLSKVTESQTAYDLRTTMNTMNSLLTKGLIKRTNYDDIVWFGWERSGIEWTITEKGKLQLSERNII